MIVCGFAGIGKSTMAKRKAGVVDLESTPFEKDWDRYITVANHLSSQGYKVLLSCHRELREELGKRGIPYMLAIPEKDAKYEYLQRYEKRGNDKEFIDLFYKNWDSFLEVLPHEKSVLVIKKGLGLEDKI